MSINLVINHHGSPDLMSKLAASLGVDEYFHGKATKAPRLVPGLLATLAL